MWKHYIRHENRVSVKNNEGYAITNILTTFITVTQQLRSKANYVSCVNSLVRDWNIWNGVLECSIGSIEVYKLDDN